MAERFPLDLNPNNQIQVAFRCTIVQLTLKVLLLIWSVIYLLGAAHEASFLGRKIFLDNMVTPWIFQESMYISPNDNVGDVPLPCDLPHRMFHLRPHAACQTPLLSNP